MPETMAGAAAAHDYGGVILYDDHPVADTRRCVHCGQHWVVMKGSGTLRGYCHKCHGHTCGPNCILYPHCIPHEVYLLMLEGKIASVDQIPIVVSVPRSVGE